MKTTEKERHEIRKGCHMYHNGRCLDTTCFCLKIHKQKFKEDLIRKIMSVDNENARLNDIIQRSREILNEEGSWYHEKIEKLRKFLG